MGHVYQAVGFNRQKVVYDLVATSGILVYLAMFFIAGSVMYPLASPETLLIRSLSTAAFGLLHIILSIGPLTRLSTRFLPLLYNRRHLGVMMAMLASGHAMISLIQFHGFGTLHPLASVLISDGSFVRLSDFPFQPFGLLAWGIILLMAVTSHDFWLTQLSAPTWKRLHMLVYVAYTALVAHVAFGIGQDALSPLPLSATAIGALWLVGLHLTAAFKSKPPHERSARPDSFVLACRVDELEDNRAVAATISGEKVAIYRDDTRIFAISGVCQHQNGPLAEGRLIDGLVTCPWHGYQYCPLTGRSPEPFTESIPTFDVRIEGGHVFVAQNPNEKGVDSTPAEI